MKLGPGTPLRVSLEFAPNAIVPVGRVALDRGTAVLEYGPEFLASRLGINPLFPPPGAELVRAAEPRTFGGLHGVLADSLPDAWGELLMRRRTAASGIDYHALTVLDKLAAVGRRGMGALTYQPAFAASDEAGIDLELLARESLEVLEGRDSDVIPQLERLGGSSGGARPKVLVAMNEAGEVRSGTDRIPAGFEAWIVKFRSARDVPDIGPLEAAYGAMARAAGVEMSESKLVATTHGPGYFATKRFDRTPGGGRRHVLSVAGLLELDWERSSLDYGELLKAVRIVTRHQGEVEKMFRRMVFNVLAHNRDDHTKQHAFLMDGTGRWTLAPAYDLTFSQGPGGEHYLTVAGNGTDVTRTAIDTVAKREGIDAAAAREVTDQAVEAVSCFTSFARDYGVSARTASEVGRALDRALKTFTG
ncbi:MAG: serine/threonine-protein kinase HipA [Candidatus Eremiobacteraeota bacterium]|nr:serine/threonine-protein kinase HipA [Candidatus Eremiobacteraeota bacterium]